MTQEVELEGETAPTALTTKGLYMRTSISLSSAYVRSVDAVARVVASAADSFHIDIAAMTATGQPCQSNAHHDLRKA